jgi:hypothetical protein
MTGLFIFGLSGYLTAVLIVAVNITKLRNEVVAIKKVLRNMFLCSFDLTVEAIYLCFTAGFSFSDFRKEIGNFSCCYAPSAPLG